jgi:nucleoid DNA-binding protein
MEEENKNRKMDLSQPGLNRKWFIKQVAEKANFFQKDIDIVIDAIEDVLSEVIRDNKVLKISGLFTMYLTKKSASKYYNPKEDKLLDTPESYYVSFKASRKLLKYLLEAQNGQAENLEPK